MVLCEHYSQKYRIDLRCVDLREVLEAGDNSYSFFSYLNSNRSILDINENESRGLILSHGQHHVIPMLIAMQGGQKYMIVFDSTSGAQIKGYFRMAALFPDFQFCLNAGTRQADDGSCMTDALCILKEALQIPHLTALIESKRIHEHPAFLPGRFFVSPPMPENFQLFKMPEQLLVTAQISRYVNEADADLECIVRSGHSLKYFREHFVVQVNLFKDAGRASTPINGYLYHKSEEHKQILDAYQQRERASSIEMEMSTTPKGRFHPISTDDWRSLNSFST